MLILSQSIQHTWAGVLDGRVSALPWPGTTKPMQISQTGTDLPVLAHTAITEPSTMPIGMYHSENSNQIALLSPPILQRRPSSRSSLAWKDECSGESHHGVKVWVTGLLNPRSIGAYCHDLASQAHYVHSTLGRWGARWETGRLDTR